MPEGYQPPVVAILRDYWKSWLIVLLVTAQNPSTFGAFASSAYPTLNLLLEMCITNQFNWPPTGSLPREKCEELRVKDTQAAAFEKHKILEYEFYLAGKPVPEESSQLLHTLITLDIRGTPRKCPPQVSGQLKVLNQQFK
jgi:integrator complex subunit 1